MRAAVVFGAGDDASIEAAVGARFPSSQIANLQVTITDQTFGTQAFRRIDVSYDFDFLIHFSDNWNGVTITATRFAPDFS
jgi:hypothetical protein